MRGSLVSEDRRFGTFSVSIFSIDTWDMSVCIIQINVDSKQKKIVSFFVE